MTRRFSLLFLAGFLTLSVISAGVNTQDTTTTTNTTTDSASTAPTIHASSATTPTTTTTFHTTTVSTSGNELAASNTSTILSSIASSLETVHDTSRTSAIASVSISSTSTTITADTAANSSAVAVSTAETPSSSATASVPISSHSSDSTQSAALPSTQETEPSSSATTYAPATDSNSDHVSVIVGVVVGVGGGLIVIAAVIVLIICLRRKRQDKGGWYDNGGLHMDHRPGKGIEKAESIESLHPWQALDERPVRVVDLLAHIDSHQKDMKLYKDEFEKLPGPHVRSRRIAKEKAYNEKNRYINILPFDETLVDMTTDDDARMYVNASYLNGHNEDKAFIATQGPQDQTVVDFWMMVWQLKSRKIVMVTNVMENFKIKCMQYWPREMNSTNKYGKITVRLTGDTSNYDFLVRKLTVQKGSEPERVVYHYHYVTWPDQGVPETCTSLLKFHNTVFEDTSTSSADEPPVIVHCSAGVGRSGTFIAVNILLKHAAQHGQLDILKCVETMRLQRMYMVQTPAQYIFIHHVLLESLLLHDVTIPTSQLNDVVARWNEPVSPDRKTMFQRQFEVLDVLKPKFNEQLYSIATDSVNTQRNRSSSTLPADCSLVCLRPVVEDENTYINAVYVNGYHKASAPYIATQMPMESTITDFWRLIIDNSCSCIIMLNELDTNNNCQQYWPAYGCSSTVGKFTVTNVGPEISSNNIIATDITVNYYGKRKPGYRSSQSSSDADDDVDGAEESAGKERGRNDIYANCGEIDRTEEKGNVLTVRHMRLLNWPNGRAFPSHQATLLAMRDEAVGCQLKNPKGRILVHCLNGAERTGLFCTLLNVIDQLEDADQVDVYDSVKRVRQARPEFIGNIDDYKYLYELTSSHLKASSELDEQSNNDVDSPLYSNISPANTHSQL